VSILVSTRMGAASDEFTVAILSRCVADASLALFSEPQRLSAVSVVPASLVFRALSQNHLILKN